MVVVVVRTTLAKLREFARCCFIGWRHPPSSAVRLPDNDDILREILLRLPPLPSSLPSASLVCKRWRRLVADPSFLRRFHQHHHRNRSRTPPPLLGYFFSHSSRGPVFVPTLAPPDRIPPERFSLPADAGEGLFILGCRHGLALLIDRVRPEAVVWDPVTGCRATVAYPPGFTTDNFFRGTVLMSTAAATADGDGHQYMRPFKAILIRIDDAFHEGRLLKRVSMCVYESQTGKWGHTISIVLPCSALSDLPSVLVGNALCGFIRWPIGILKFDLERHSLGVIRTPQNLHRFVDRSFIQVVRTTQQDGELGLAVLYGLTMELWERKVTSSPHGGTVRWVIQRTIQLGNLLRVPRMNITHNCSLPSASILGFDEDSNVIHVSTYTAGAFAIRLDSMKFTKLFNVDGIGPYPCHPYAGFYTAAGVPRLSAA